MATQWLRKSWMCAALLCGAFTFALVPARAAGPESVAELAAAVSPAVVNIATSQRFGFGTMFPEAPEGSPLNDLLENGNPNRGQGNEAMREARSLGSGFFVSADGYLVTNYHVIAGANSITVFTADEQRYEARLVGADDKMDLAVLKVEGATPFPFVEFGDSDDADIGDWVMVVGNPFGLGGSVSLGIVSARNRNINAGPYDDFIQTDAAINQGSSGGPVFDMDGRVIGIATAIIAQGGTSLGIGFAIPTNQAKHTIDQLSEFGETSRGWLGVAIQLVTDDIALAVGQSSAVGALISDVTVGGPSEGLLQSGDVVLTVAGQVISSVEDLPRVVSQIEVGSLVTLEVWRNGTKVDIEVALGRLEDGELLLAQQRTAFLSDIGGSAASLDDGIRLSDEAVGAIGFSVLPMTRESRRSMGLIGSADGLIVHEVFGGLDAEERGIRPGVVLSHFDGVELADIRQLERLVKEARAAARDMVLAKFLDLSGVGYLVAIDLDG